jgi:hypothetical protein
LTAELLTEAWAYVKQDEKELPTVERPARTLNVHRDSLYAWAKPSLMTSRSTRRSPNWRERVGFQNSVAARNQRFSGCGFVLVDQPSKN